MNGFLIFLFLSPFFFVDVVVCGGHRATSNKKLRETVSLELSFVNSNLQLLKEQLAALNSSVEVYQGDQLGLAQHIPMIPLGLKETKEVPFHDTLQVSPASSIRFIKKLLI